MSEKCIVRKQADDSVAQLGDVGVDPGIANQVIHEISSAPDSDLGVRSAKARIWKEDTGSSHISLFTLELSADRYARTAKDAADTLRGALELIRADSNLSNTGKLDAEARARASKEKTAAGILKGIADDFERGAADYRARWGGTLAAALTKGDPTSAAERATKTQTFISASAALSPDAFARALVEHALGTPWEIEAVRAAAVRLSAGDGPSFDAWALIATTIGQRARERVRERLSDNAIRDAAIRLSELDAIERTFRSSRQMIEKNLLDADLALSAVESARQRRGF